MLTREIIKKLRAPFEPEQIKWKIQTNPREGDEFAIVVCYVDARDVAERLDLATDGDWSSDFALPQVVAGTQHALECRLTVCGITRVDVGAVAPPRDGEDATKDLYSDALKRAAVQFGVAAHIYRFPTVRARVKRSGRTFFITPEAQRELLALNKAIIAGDALPRFQHIQVFGSAYGAAGWSDSDAPEDGAHPQPPAAQNGNGHGSNARYIARIRELWQAERELGGTTPPEELKLDLDTMYEPQLIRLGKAISKRVEQLRAVNAEVV